MRHDQIFDNWLTLFAVCCGFMFCLGLLVGT